MRSRFLFVAIAIVLLLEPRRPAAQAVDRDARLKKLDAEAAALAGEQQTLLGELRRLELDRQKRGIELAKTTDALAALTAQSHVTAARAAQAERELAALQPVVRERLVRLYKLGRLGYSRLLLDVNEARTFRETTRVVSAMARRDRELLDRYRAALATLSATRTRLESERTAAAALQVRLQQEQASLDRVIAARGTRVKEIQQRQDLNHRLVVELDAARGRLDASVGRLPPSASGVGTGATAGGEAAARAGGGFTWPVVGQPQTQFGRERSSRFGTEIARNGIQIGAEDGASVTAARDGTVAYADVFAGFGQLVILDHGGKTYSLYGHLSTMGVVRGDKVGRGQPLGTVGRTPTGEPALYFELRIDGRPVDPVRWLKR
jgi:septal ring factor EnvC (AmiA/AmiB activator)